MDTGCSSSPRLAEPLPRHQNVAVRVGEVTIGGGAPVIVQSMTNTDTADIENTLTQITELVQAGSEMVRITVDREEAAEYAHSDNGTGSGRI